MIVRIQIMKILPDGTRCVANKWAIYLIDKKRSFLNLFDDIKNGLLTCGEVLDLSWTDSESFQTYTLNSSIKIP